ncbi:MAG: hypothetical protein BWY63_03474 [Chloroflexi bacterium ADurb.Bin360]|nr:MAG: hypothetical protein BWY63_03474 [Chloroflexi bacterium ADurb.Bin360]
MRCDDGQVHSNHITQIHLADLRTIQHAATRLDLLRSARCQRIAPLNAEAAIGRLQRLYRLVDLEMRGIVEPSWSRCTGDAQHVKGIREQVGDGHGNASALAHSFTSHACGGKFRVVQEDTIIIVSIELARDKHPIGESNERPGSLLRGFPDACLARYHQPADDIGVERIFRIQLRQRIKDDGGGARVGIHGPPVVVRLFPMCSRSTEDSGIVQVRKQCLQPSVVGIRQPERLRQICTGVMAEFLAILKEIVEHILRRLPTLCQHVEQPCLQIGSTVMLNLPDCLKLGFEILQPSL